MQVNTSFPEPGKTVINTTSWVYLGNFGAAVNMLEELVLEPGPLRPV